MKKLTNLQMGVIVDKIYKELSEKIEPINKARLEAIDIKKELKGDKIAPLLLEIEEISPQISALDAKRTELKRQVGKLNDGYYYSTPSYENYTKTIRNKKASIITIDRKDIEAGVILSDVTDLETLIANITRSITKDIPELN